MQGLNPITMQCTYSTPCGWCTKWDKKCDRKIPEYGIRRIVYENDSPCQECSKRGWDMPECKECVRDNYKYFNAKEN